MHALFEAPPPRNEAVLDFCPGSSERIQLDETLDELLEQQMEIPLIIGGERVRTGQLGTCRVPHDHRRELGTYHKASPEHIEMAIRAALSARDQWANTPWQERAAIMLRAADILTGRKRMLIDAAAMLGLSKTPHQAEIDAVCELADFIRFNVSFMTAIYGDQPISPPGQWNRMDWRPLEGFVFAVSPFNFLSIAGNLPTAPALMGNTVVWKPASSAVFPAHLLMELFEEAGLPPGVINMVPGAGAAVGPVALTHEHLAGVHFTGSTETFRQMWQVIAKTIEPMKSWPRIVGETGGKDFVFAHPSADMETLVVALIRGAFEYQGQKCSAASRCYIPESLWPGLRDRLVDEVAQVSVGDVRDAETFMGAVIDRTAFDRLNAVIEDLKSSPGCTILTGGEVDDRVGYFVKPTVVEVQDPHHRAMTEEFFGPILACFVYPDSKYEETLDICSRTSPYGLTGAIFARDRQAVALATSRLRDAAGNFYINDKPTGAVVGQQPFGGARASGTNDKAGSKLNLLRWASPRTIKETFDAPTDWRYPYMGTGS